MKSPYYNKAVLADQSTDVLIEWSASMISVMDIYSQANDAEQMENTRDRLHSISAELLKRNPSECTYCDEQCTHDEPVVYWEGQMYHHDCYGDARHDYGTAMLDQERDHQYQDKSPEQLAGEVMQDKIDMYRNEY